MKIRLLVCLAAVSALVLAGCSSSPQPDGSAKSPSSAAASTASASEAPATAGGTPEQPLPEAASPYDALPEEARAILEKPFTGDFDEMVKRRVIRAGVVFNRTQYFIDKGVQRGISYEALKLLEDEVNTRLKTGLLKVHVAIVPLSRDQLFPALEAGTVDLVAAALTVTPERQTVAAFSDPTRSGVSEVVVTAPDVPPVASSADLSGREVFIRKSSSYYESIQELNASLAKAQKPPVVVKEAPEALEDDDILEMVNADLVDVTVVDDFMAEFWRDVFPNIRVNAATVRTGGNIAVGVRKNNPKMLQAVNTWIKEYGPRTAFGNTMEKRYLKDATYVKNAGAESERKKLRDLVVFFQKYSQQYDLDYLLMMAQGYQESGLDQNAKSHVGAVGVMQVMPATGKDLAVGDITKTEPNIHAGVKYIRFMVDQYYKDEPMDRLNKGLMTFASYNAGPARIRQLRAETKKRGLDPNVWFGNVERVVSERIGRETVQYVSNIFKYYVAYKLITERETARDRAKTAMQN